MKPNPSPRIRLLFFLLTLNLFSGLCSRALATDVSFYILQKEQEFFQSAAGAPVAASPQGFRINSSVDVASSTSVSSAVLKLPDGSTQTLSYSSDDQSYSLRTYYDTQAALDAAYPAGGYTLTINAVHDGAKQIPLSLPATTFPNGPHLSNYSAAQSIDPSAPFVFTWDSFAGGTENDFIQVMIQNNQGDVASSPDFGKPNYLNGKATSFTLPAGVLQAGSQYEVRLAFYKPVSFDTTTYPGATGVVVFGSRTKLNIQTAGGASNADVISYSIIKEQDLFQATAANPSLIPNSAFRFTARVDVGSASAMSGATLKGPSGSSRQFTYNADDNEWRVKDVFDQLSGVEAQDPAGTYVFTLNTAHNGVKQPALTLPSTSFPNAPHLANYAAAQTIDPATAFTVTWDPFQGGGSEDYIHVRIRDSGGNDVFESAGYFDANHLTGTATSLAIPAQTLAPGATYDLQITFSKLISLDSTSYPGARGIVAFTSLTDANIQTMSGSSGPDATFYSLQKQREFFQQDAGSPVLLATAGFRFNSTVKVASQTAVSGASLKSPGGAVQPLTYNSQDQEFDLRVFFDTQSALDSAYPAGSYLLTVNATQDGIKELPLTFPAPAFPNPPHINNYTAAQAIDPSAAFNLTWDAFAGGTENDYAQVIVKNSQGNELLLSPEFGQAGHLTGKSTSFSLPANLLQPGSQYQVKLTFYKLITVDSTTYPGATGVVVFSTLTRANIQTASSGPDVNIYGVVKTESFVQTSVSAPTHAATPWIFGSFLDENGANRVTGVSVKLPTGAVKALVPEGGDSFAFQENFATQGLMDAAYPDGDYTVTMNTVHDGTKTTVLNLSGNAYPATPHISNFDTAQSIDPASDFVLRWDPLNGSLLDFVQIRIEDDNGNKIAGSGDAPGGPGALNGTATSFTIPKGSLSPGHNYHGRLFIAHGSAIDTSYALGFAAYIRETEFPVKTSGTPVYPVLGKPFLLPDGRLGFQLQGVPGKFYDIEASTNLNADWGPVLQVGIASNSSTVDVAVQRTGPYQFFRARER